MSSIQSPAEILHFVQDDGICVILSGAKNLNRLAIVPSPRYAFLMRAFSKFLLGCVIAVLFVGCSGGHGHHEGTLVFKGNVADVHYMLTEGVTVVIDADGKKFQIKGLPGIPKAEVEIYHLHGEEYEIFQSAPKQS